MRKRTRARELALQILYQIDLRDLDVAAELDELLLASDEPEDVREFARELVSGTVEGVVEADERITVVAEHWDIGRMAAIDRNILRMAVFEMLARPDIPRKVSINEAIDLGKKFSTENSGAFINGILDRIRSQIEREREEER